MGGIGGGNLGSLGYTINVAGAEEAVKQIDGVGSSADSAASSMGTMGAEAATAGGGIDALGGKMKAIAAPLRAAAQSISAFLGPLGLIAGTVTGAVLAINKWVNAATEAAKVTAAAANEFGKLAASIAALGEADLTAKRNAEIAATYTQLLNAAQKVYDADKTAGQEAFERARKIRDQLVSDFAIEQERVAFRREANVQYRKNIEAEEAANAQAAARRKVDDEQALIRIQQRTDAIIAEGEALTRANEAAMKLAASLKSAIAAQNSANNAVFASDRMPALFSRMADQLDQINNRMPRR